VNHIRFPKEDQLSDRARRDNKVTNGDRVGYVRCYEWLSWESKVYTV